MPRHVALLRGINVGGRNKVAMADLRQVAADLGFTDVSTYIQSGNLLFAADERDTAGMAAALERRIAEFGLKFGIGAVPRPPHWSGFRLTPEHMEFWRDRPFRLHERLAFDRAEGGWTVKRLYP